jgi:heme-degrading monooxygenase HmoA
MFVHIWKMRARKKKTKTYEEFGRQVTLPALKKIPGCFDAHFIRLYGARKPEYFWFVFWKDKEALEAARTNPAWREQIKKFEAGGFYKSIPMEWVCELLASAGERPGLKAPRAKKNPRGSKVPKETGEEVETADAPETSEKPAVGFTGPTPEGE